MTNREFARGYEHYGMVDSSAWWASGTKITPGWASATTVASKHT
jgi:hypothetical protein